MGGDGRGAEQVGEGVGPRMTKPLMPHIGSDG